MSNAEIRISTLDTREGAVFDTLTKPQRRQLSHLYNLVFPSIDYSEAHEIIKMYHKDGLFVLAMHGDTEDIVGFGVNVRDVASGYFETAVLDLDEETPVVELAASAVFPNFRHQGIYQRLLDSRIEEAGKGVTIFSITENPIVVEQLKKRNFKKAPEHTMYYRNS